MFKSVEDFQALSKTQMEAAAQSAAALSQGVQKLLVEGTEFSRKSLESSTEALRSLMASRTPDRALQVQMEFAKLTYDSFVAGSASVTGIVSSTAQNMFKPLEGALHKVQDGARGTTVL